MMKLRIGALGTIEKPPFHEGAKGGWKSWSFFEVNHGEVERLLGRHLILEVPNAFFPAKLGLDIEKQALVQKDTYIYIHLYPLEFDYYINTLDTRYLLETIILGMSNSRFTSKRTGAKRLIVDTTCHMSSSQQVCAGRCAGKIWVIAMER